MAMPRWSDVNRRCDFEAVEVVVMGCALAQAAGTMGDTEFCGDTEGVDDSGRGEGASGG